MKKRNSLFIKAALALVLSLCVLSSGMVYIFASDVEAQPAGNDALAPEVSAPENSLGTETAPPATQTPDTGDTTTPTEPETPGDVTVSDTEKPVSQEQLAAKFAEYTHVTEENGKSVVTLYSAEQIAAINARRAAGEQMPMKNEEVLFLINDTVKLFESYDIVRVVDINGTVHTFRGISFYSSEEYYNSFGVVTEQTNDSFDLEGDVYNAMLYRLEALCTAVSRHAPNDKYLGLVLFTEVDVAHVWYTYDSWARTYYYSTRESTIAEEYRISGINTLSKLPGGIFVFWNEKVEYVADLTDLAETTPVQLYSQDIFDNVRGETKYDFNADAVVVIELWDQVTGELKARLRFDSVKDAEVIAKIAELWQGVINNITSIPVEEYMVMTNYRVAVYMTGVPGLLTEKNGDSFMYRPDGNLNYWSFCEGNENFLDYPIQLGGSQAIAEYINQLIAAAFNN